jgi:protocatechuate 3,4-dioxygenase beta subunit
LAGRVIDSSGHAIAGLTLDVLTSNLAQRRVALTDRDGRFELTRMPPGKFVVGVASAAPTKSAKPARVYFPGQIASTAATRVTIAEGARVQLPDFRLPASLRYVAVEGFVLDADGGPAEGAQVYLKGAGEGDRIVGEPVAVDFVGRFVVAALAGTEYAIFAERKRGSRVDSTDQIRINSTESQKLPTLVLRRRY